MKMVKVSLELNFHVNDLRDHEEIKERLYEILMDSMETEELNFRLIETEDEED
jgi:hypothetical protein